MHKFIIISLALLFSLSLFSHPSFQNNNPDIYNQEVRADSIHSFDVIKYDISIILYDQNNSIEGTVITTAISQEALTSVQHELVGLTVADVSVNGVPTTFTHQSGVITINTGEIPAQTQFTTAVHYHGIPTHTTDGYANGMTFSPTMIFTVSDPNAARYWWPCYDHPWDKALVDLHIKLRGDWLVGANGIRNSITTHDDGRKTHHWLGSNPMATYLVCLTASNYQEINQTYGNIPIQNFVSPAQYQNAVTDFSTLPNMMAVFSAKYGSYPFEKYGNCVTNITNFGAMEHQTMTTLGTGFINGNHGGELVIAHELAHQWFGNCLTPLTWADVWLSESFATYSEAVYIEATQNYQAMCNYVQQDFQNYSAWEENPPATIYDPPYLEYFALYEYQKGACVLHMLRLTVGNDAFWQILQTYFATYHNQNVITSEFQQIAENISGLDLDYFFNEWIYSSGTPTFDYSVMTSNPVGNPESICILAKTASNTTTQFSIVTPFQITHTNGTSDSVLVMVLPSVSHQIVPVANYASLQFDPNHWILQRGVAEKTFSLTAVLPSNQNIVLTWSPYWDQLPLLGYNVYRSLTETGTYTLVNQQPVNATSFIDSTVTNDVTYYYKVVAVASFENQTFYSKFTNVLSGTPLTFPLDQGILVIDDTRNGTGAPNNPDDFMVDEFYQQALDTPYTNYDITTQGMPNLDLMRHYSLIIWHDDDFSQHQINTVLNDLGGYVIGGGKLLISGWKTLEIVPVSFLTMFFGINQATLISSAQVSSFNSDLYPDLAVDPAKLLAQWNGNLPLVYSFPENLPASMYYTVSTNTSFDNKACALKAPDYDFILLGFPLYFCQADQVEDFCHQVLTEWGYTSNSDLNLNPDMIQLSQNYPNPFNPETSISFNLPVNAHVDLTIYNLKGQKVKTLINENKVKGRYTEAWNGTNQEGNKTASGIYFYKLTSGDQQIVRKMILIK